MPLDRLRAWSTAAALLLVLAAAMGGAAALARVQDSTGSAPLWAFDPAEPGPDRPPVGRSLFDQVFAAERGDAAVMDVPYPFTALRQRLMGHLAAEAANAGDSDVLAQVLIPHGRALQRDAAKPDYFASPRLVLAVVADPPSPPHPLGARLKDRLYIGYQEKARSLEVISYNDAAGRFEFQVVEDYRPGGIPRVVYARRTVCIACHQNGGPIFSEPPWSETNADDEVARRLAAQAPEFHGVAAEDGSRPFDQALLISTAVARVNFYPAYQRVWRDGCGEDPSAIRCRAALLTAVLQVKLSGGRHFDARAEPFRDAVEHLARASAKTWPSGLAIPRALIANRDPLTDGQDVTALFDPLRARPPLEVWPGAEPAVIQDIVAGLAQLLSATDAGRLDQRLRALAGNAVPPRERLRAPCAVSRRSLEGVGERYLFRCERDGPDSLLLNGHFYLRPEAPLEGAVPWLVLSNEGEEAKFEDLAIAADAPDLDTGRDGRTSVTFQPLNLRGGLRPRLPDGRVIETVALAWATAIEDTADPSAEIPDYPANGEAVLTVVDDFAPLRAALSALARQAEQGAPGVLSDTAFHGGRAMAAVLAALGVDSPTGCCGDDEALPPLAVQGSASHVGVERAYADHCGACHAMASPFPPNFLHGGMSDGDGIARCAERIAVRLAMWDRPEGTRPTSPMPPEPWLKGAGWSPEAWRESAPLASLRDHLAGLLARAGTSLREVEARGSQAYEALPPCLEQADPDRLD